MPSIELGIKEQAHALGFELVGIAPASDADGFAHLEDWLAQGFAGEMEYMARHAEARRNPQSVLPDVRSVVMVAINYKERPAAGSGQQTTNKGRVSCYAGGADYHDVLRAKLKGLLAWIQGENPGVRGRAVIDTAPLLERDFARRSGLGWFGKNTMLLNRWLGSYFFLGALLLDLELQADDPFSSSHCGTCTRCLDACPTDAFVGPFQLDARRCISYLTIELRGVILEELRAPMDDWVFGCDICQEVCPWNRKAPVGREPSFMPTQAGTQIDLVEILNLSDEDFRSRFRDTPLWRAGRVGLARNAAIALGNHGNEHAVPALRQALADVDPAVRDAAAWALERIRNR
ncbi:MAG: tRNA epoxyqueuosine(34) reductase QueG [Planctomycetes bacterium]|nr:tRNA epoxyqueuosine(34) reductase QueG [Planctomycetota bacterium]